nr:hypothetical protein CFP56_70406 [Quercus suber]
MTPQSRSEEPLTQSGAKLMRQHAAKTNDKKHKDAAAKAPTSGSRSLGLYDLDPDMPMHNKPKGKTYRPASAEEQNNIACERSDGEPALVAFTTILGRQLDVLLRNAAKALKMALSSRFKRKRDATSEAVSGLPWISDPTTSQPDQLETESHNLMEASLRISMDRHIRSSALFLGGAMRWRSPGLYHAEPSLEHADRLLKCDIHISDLILGRLTDQERECVYVDHHDTFCCGPLRQKWLSTCGPVDHGVLSDASVELYYAFILGEKRDLSKRNVIVRKTLSVCVVFSWSFVRCICGAILRFYLVEKKET